jgi:hypothetical protein
MYALWNRTWAGSGYYYGRGPWDHPWYARSIGAECILFSSAEAAEFEREHRCHRAHRAAFQAVPIPYAEGDRT